jgi:predicted nucleic acid-binding protein
LVLLVDSSVWIDYFNGESSLQTDYLDRALGEENIIIGDLILAEVLQGFRSKKDFETAQIALLKFPYLSMVGLEIALQSAQNYRFLRAKGITVRKTIDCLIATFCIEHNISLLHNDRDFTPFEHELGLKVLHP